MAFNERLAQRVRDLIQDNPGCVEKKMFGGIGFLLRGNMACGVIRDDLIISAIIEDQGQFLRLLRLLLAGDASFSGGEEWLKGAFSFQKTSVTWEDLDLPLLEDLIRALSRSPETKIDRIAEIVEKLRRTPQGQQIIPAEFDQLWQTILQARKEIQ